MACRPIVFVSPSCLSWICIVRISASQQDTSLCVTEHHVDLLYNSCCVSPFSEVLQEFAVFTASFTQWISLYVWSQRNAVPSTGRRYNWESEMMTSRSRDMLSSLYVTWVSLFRQYAIADSQNGGFSDIMPSLTHRLTGVAMQLYGVESRSRFWTQNLSTNVKCNRKSILFIIIMWRNKRINKKERFSD